MLGFFARTFEELLPVNPLVLFKKEQASKLGKVFERGLGRFSTNAPEMMKEYFAGKQYGSTADLGAELSRARTRKVTAGIGLGLVTANALGINPLGVTDAATNTAMLGVHSMIGSSMIKYGAGLSKGLGVGYLGLTALNTFRRGENAGPM